MRINPVLLKELKVRMRGWKAPIIIIVYLGVMTLMAAFILLNIFHDGRANMSSNDNTVVYIALASLQFVLIAFIAPALTSGSISGERERQTLDLLTCTELPARSIILGKLFASLSQIILLVLASLPIFSIVFLFGGIAFGEVAELFIFYIVVAIMFGSIGLFFSTHLKKTTGSNVVTYAVVIFLLFGTIFITVFYLSFAYRNTSTRNAAAPLLYINPLAGFISLISAQFGETTSAFGVGALGMWKGKIQFWHINTIINIAISAILLALSALKITPVKKFRIRKK